MGNEVVDIVRKDFFFKKFSFMVVRGKIQNGEDDLFYEIEKYVYVDGEQLEMRKLENW